jgi:DNA-binding transcriptional ArsR family regulator
MITLLVAEARVIISKALACLKVIEFLRGGEHACSEIFNLSQLDKSTISQHLLGLTEVGITSLQKTGTAVIYKLDVPNMLGFLNCTTLVIENNIEEQSICLP